MVLLVQFDPTLFALNVIVKIPLPTNTALVTPSVLTGKTKYEPENHQLLWKVKRFPGGAEYIPPSPLMFKNRSHKMRYFCVCSCDYS
jgi:AP-2 complex subunit mu-1